MINFLITRMITQLSADLTRVGAPAIVAGPADPPAAGQLPRTVLSPGALLLPPPFGDLASGEMRPRDITDTFAVNTTSPATVQGPYTLSQSPLQGTISCRFHWILAGDDFEGKKQRIYPRVNGQGDGFEIDLATRKLSVFFAAPLPGTPTLEVDYEYPAVFTMCEFSQILLLEAYGSSAAEAEKWAALSVAVVTTRAKSLLSDANQSSNFQSFGSYVSRSLINTFQFSDGLVDRPAANVFRYQLNFNITGQLILERTFTDSVDVIQKIYSPGHKSDPGTINIEANLD